MLTKLSQIAQRLLGLIFVVFGFNGFFHFIPVPPMSPAGAKFIGDLINTGYMLPLWKGTEILGGALLLTDILSAFGLLLLAPIVVNILAFHLMLDPRNSYVGITLAALTLVSAWRHRSSYAPIFTVLR